ncbi:hypothetical protein AB0N61_16310 [Microbacterium sp. NPDC089320]|uniref:hypothetical protein n=1 Tax=Microbacterium sp. NPDC089320 TaxID=3155182 RepID=UPI0034388295
MTNEQDAGSPPEHVVPPEAVRPPEPADAPMGGIAPNDSPGWATTPLAPPLGAPGAPQAPWPGATPPPPPGYPQPGYNPTAYPQPGYTQPAYPSSGGQPPLYDQGAYPLSSVAPPPARSGSRSTAVLLSVIGAVVALGIVAIAVFIGLLAGGSQASPSPVAPPSGIAEDPYDQPSEAPSDPPSEDPSDGSGDPDAAAGAEIADALQAKIDEYKRLRDSGALWQSIPDTEFNRTAVSAFLYFLTDMKVATIWGVDEAQAQEYDERMAMLEERLLAQQPLGDDINITLEEKIFTYDGETGEGGYTAR